MKLRSPQLAEELLAAGVGQFIGQPDFLVEGISDVFNCQPADLLYVDSERVIGRFNNRKSMVVLTTSTLLDPLQDYLRDCTFYVTYDPFAVFSDLCIRLFPRKLDFSQADGAREARDGPSTIHRTAVIGANVRIGPYVYIGAGASIGDNSIIHPNVTLYDGVIIGSRVVVHAGAVVGSDGFYYARDPVRPVPRIGSVRVADDVEIGANTTIDRGAMGVTRIGTGTKIDNSVHIAHDVKIGTNCLIQAHVGITGQARIGDNVVLHGMSGVVDIVTVADGTHVLPLTGVTKDTSPNSVWVGNPAQPRGGFKRDRAQQRMIPVYLQQVREMREALQSLVPEIALTDTPVRNLRSILAFITSATGLSYVTLATPLQDGELDSLDKEELQMMLEDHFGIKLQREATNVATVKELVVTVNRAMLSQGGPPTKEGGT